MSNPTVKYQIMYDGHVLNGYAQSEEIPVTARNGRVEIINRDGGSLLDNGAEFRNVSFTFDILSRLGNNSTGLQHLGDCMDQYRETLRYVTRVPSASTLFIGGTSHYLIARYNSITSPLLAPDSRRIKYSLEFVAQPWFYGPAVYGSDSISGDDTIVLNMPDTRKTYPSFKVPSGITRMSVSHTPSGKSFTFSGSHANIISINCGTLMVQDDTTGANKITTIITGPDFGIYHVGSGSATFNISNVVGAGTVQTVMVPRLER